MEKTLNFRSQELFGQPEFSNGHWSAAQSFTPSDQMTLKRRGHLFVVATLKGPANFDAAAAGKIIVDALQEEYYSLPEGSPLSALEKAVATAHRRLLDIAHNPNTGKEGIDFDIVVAVLWGNILYLARLGTAAVYILRGGAMKEIGPANEAQISVASGMVAPQDILILGSFRFRELFPVTFLEKNLDNLEALVQNSPQKEDLTVLVVHLFEEKTVSPDEIIKFVSFDKEKIATLGSKIKAAIRLPKIKSEKPDVSPSLPGISGIYLDRSSPIRRRTGRKRRLAFIIVVLLLLFAASTAYTLRVQQKTRVEKEIAKLTAEAEQKLLSASDFVDLNNRTAQDLAGQVKDLAQKIKSLGDNSHSDSLNTRADQILNRATKANTLNHAELIYDFLIQGKSSQPTALVGDGQSLYIADLGTNSLYKLLMTQTPVKVERVGGEQLSSPRLISYYDGDLFGLDNNGLFKVSLSKSTTKNNLIKNLDTTDTTAFNVYLGNLYLLDTKAGQLNKYTPAASGYSGRINWLKDKVDLSTVMGMTNDGSIYLLFADDSIKKFTLGKAADFSLSGLPQPLNQVKSIYTNPDSDDLYILDSDGKRLIVVSKDGVYQKQMLLTDTNLKSPSVVWIDISKKLLYLLDQTKVYRVDLQGEI